MMNDILMVGLLYIAVLVEIIILGEINLLSHYYLFVGALSIYIQSISILIKRYVLALVVYSILRIHTTMPLE